MDQKIVFVAVFLFTLTSTILVATVSVITGQSLIATVFYTLSAMWVIGILSQILLQNLYASIVRPMQEEREEIVEELVRDPLDGINLEEIEEIDDVKRQLEESQEIEETIAETLSQSNQDVRG